MENYKRNEKRYMNSIDSTMKKNSSLHPGLYEQLINRVLRQELEAIPAERKSVAPVDPAEAAEVLSRYIAEAAKRALSGMAEGRGDLADQVALANRLIGLLPETEGQGIDERAEQLMALLAEQDPALALGRTASDAVRPETSIAQSSPSKNIRKMQESFHISYEKCK